MSRISRLPCSYSRRFTGLVLWGLAVVGLGAEISRAGGAASIADSLEPLNRFPRMVQEYFVDQVRKVDAENGRLTIRHGEIKNLGMPPMTMVFQVRDKSWLEGVQPGSRIRFQAVEEGGKYVVTALEPAP